MLKIIYQTPLSVAVNAGRTCWQSQDKGGCYASPTNEIVEADKEFLDRILNKHKHRSVGEHIRFVLECNGETELLHFFQINKFSFVEFNTDNNNYYISTNLRVLLELKDNKPSNYVTDFLNVIKQVLDKNLLFLFKEIR